MTASQQPQLLQATCISSKHFSKTSHPLKYWQVLVSRCVSKHMVPHFFFFFFKLLLAFLLRCRKVRTTPGLRNYITPTSRHAPSLRSRACPTVHLLFSTLLTRSVSPHSHLLCMSAAPVSYFGHLQLIFYCLWVLNSAAMPQICCNAAVGYLSDGWRTYSR